MSDCDCSIHVPCREFIKYRKAWVWNCHLATDSQQSAANHGEQVQSWGNLPQVRGHDDVFQTTPIGRRPFLPCGRLTQSVSR